MSLKDIFKQQSKGMESLATTGTIGMHMVSGPLVGFAIGYGLDAWLETGPWLKLVFLVIGIIAGFMNVLQKFSGGSFLGSFYILVLCKKKILC